MKPAIILEGLADAAILRAVLPPDLLDAWDLRVLTNRSTLVSVARTLLIKNHAPVAVVLDTETLATTAIAETVRTTRHLLASVAGDTPFEVIYFVPEIESIFFQDSIDLQRIFPQVKGCFIPQFATTQPKEQLEVLFKQGGGVKNLADFLSELSLEEIESLRTRLPMQQLITFLASSLAPQVE